jgi:DNA repair exonuclease SbcCD ATPase subunit
MTFTDQIDEARRALEELTTDEAELTRLHADQVTGVQALKDGGSKDFTLLSNLEAKRSALASMLSEQRAQVTQAKNKLADLEAVSRKGEQLADLRARVASLQGRKQETDGLLIELGAFLTAHLARITAARLAWAGEQRAAAAMAQSAFGIGYLEQADQNNGRLRSEWSRAFSEIGPGAAEALTLLPTSKFSQGLQRLYSRPNARQGHAGDIAYHTASSPLIWYMDRPVSLAMAEAIEGADSALPEALKGGERVY